MRVGWRKFGDGFQIESSHHLHKGQIEKDKGLNEEAYLNAVIRIELRSTLLEGEVMDFPQLMLSRFLDTANVAQIDLNLLHGFSA